MSLTAEVSVDSLPEEAIAAPLQIREALPEDREAAWQLQQAAFSLPPEGPSPHPGTRQQLRVAVRDGRVVSCLTLVEANLALRGVPVRMGGLRHVATHPDEQNRGYASALIRNTLHAMRDLEIGVSILFPFSFRYYRKFGYELGGNYCHFWCRPSNIPAFVERSACRPATPGDAEALAALYARRVKDRSCSMERDPARWSAICSDARYQTSVFGPDGALEGFAVVEEARDSYGGRLMRVLDLCGETAPAWRGLLGCLSQAQAESVEWLACAGELAASGLLRSAAPLREGFKPRGIATIRPQFQIRITDLPHTLKAIVAGLPAGRFRLALHARDDQLPENGKPVALVGNGDRVEVKPAKAGDPRLEADIRILSQIISGYLSPADAVSQELARCSGADALEIAETLFPVGDPFLSELDRF